MLLHIDPVLTPDLLHALAGMGHDDSVAVVDANFTASTLSEGKPLIRLPGLSLERVCAAVLSVLPLSESLKQPVGFMRVCNQPLEHRNPAQLAVMAHLHRVGVANERIEPIERFAFYDRVRAARVIVQTGDLRPYANFLFYKGLITSYTAPL